MSYSGKCRIDQKLYATNCRIGEMVFDELSCTRIYNIMLINIKMLTIVGILTFMSRVNFVLSRVEHEKSFIILGPDLEVL